MVQFNLLPDVKIQYVKTQKLKRMVIVIAFVSVAVSVGLLLIMFSLVQVQKQHISNLNKDIDEKRTELDNTKDLTKILSVQNQLKTLPALYDGRKAADRLPEFIDQTTPVGMGISELVVDFDANTMQITGEAVDLKTMNAYVDTLKYTTFKESAEGDERNAFSGVVITELGRDKEEATFKVNFAFDPAIFDVTKEITLVVPSLVTTRAQAPSPELFNGTLTPPVEGQ